MSRTVRTRIACVVGAALVISWGGPGANAFWQTFGSNGGAAKADSIPAVVAPTASVSAGNAAISWVQGSTAAGRPVSGYTVARYSSATGGTKVAASGGCAGTIATLGCTESALPGGTWYYTVTPVLASWLGVESARSGGVVGDSTPPATPIFNAPPLVNLANAASVPLSGSAEAGSSVTVTVTDAGAAHTASQTLTANGSAQWTAANFDLTTFNDGTITYRAVATDAAGNASAPGAATSQKDATAPTAKVTLVNGPDPVKNTLGFAEAGDKVVITYSETMNASSICSAWASNSTDYTINGNNAVSIQISSAKVLTASVTGCPTLRIGTVALDGVYTATAPLVFGGAGNNASSVAWNAAAKTLTLTLGKMSSGSLAATAAGEGSPTLAPPAGVIDLSGNQAIGVTSAASRF
jgi:hypothetical protein